MSIILDRARDLIINPRVTWHMIKDEQVDIKPLFANYAAPLALVPPVASLIGMTIIGLRVPGDRLVRVPFFDALLTNAAAYLFSLLAVLITAWAVQQIAGLFKSKAALIAAAKLCVYSMSPVWLAGIFSMVPGLGVLSLLGAYGVYLFYLGLPVLIDVPDNKVVLYAVLSLTAAFFVSLILSLILISTVYGPIYMKLLAV